ncbi:MAG: extracellular solute-binding protein [Bacilli bacterium]|nr:extracellular solute-binding protein [Bacilli bacterium]
MKKNFMKGSILALSFLALTACGGTSPAASSQAASSGAASSGAASSGASVESSVQSVDPNAINVLVWVAENILDLTKAQLAEVKAELEGMEAFAGKTINYTVNPVGEGEAAGNMITDVESGADIYGFAQDQLARLYSAGALTEITGTLKATIQAENDVSGVNAATFGDKLIAFPMTSDNGYFLYYDKSVLSEEDVDTWEDLIAACEGANKNLAFNASSAWYNFGFFYGGGADSVWTADASGAFTAYDDTYATNGMPGAKGLLKVVTSTAYVDSSNAPTSFESNAAACVSGTWDYKDTKDILGDNIGCAALPDFTVDGETYHTGSFSGNKLIGVKPQTDALKSAVCALTAQKLTNAKGQLERFNLVQWGPSNKVAAADPAVVANPALVALAEQNVNAKPQGQFPGAWWDTAGAIGNSLKDLGAGAADADIQGILDTYNAALEGMLG